MSSQARIAAVVLGVAAVALGQEALAATVYLDPASQTVLPANYVGEVPLELWMNFDEKSEATVGGGIDFSILRAGDTLTFAPSDYFKSLTPDFTGHGTLKADKDYEIHFGIFPGSLSGKHDLGTITFSVNAPLPAGHSTGLAVAINSTYGEFGSATVGGQVVPVTLGGAVITAVPELSSHSLLLLGMGALVPMVGKRRHRTSRRA